MVVFLWLANSNVVRLRDRCRSVAVCVIDNTGCASPPLVSCQRAASGQVRTSQPPWCDRLMFEFSNAVLLPCRRLALLCRQLWALLSSHFKEKCRPIDVCRQFGEIPAPSVCLSLCGATAWREEGAHAEWARLVSEHGER